METTAVIGAVLLGVVMAFQLALAAGMPWGAASWGGQHSGVLPSNLRASSLGAGLVAYPMLIVVVLRAGGVLDLGWPNPGPITMWVLAGFLGLGSVANFISRSKPERIWGPVALGAAICCALLAMGL
ncbi:MAG: hypothetical protein HKN46_06315 [Acidimicrobiia bacterium]|nr:hypothetical protein [Acidimicrobiia bacterium]